jgi:hypothetical protein
MYYATRVIAGLIAGAIGAVAGAVATAVVAFLTYGVRPLSALFDTGGPKRYILLSTTAFVAAFLPVMAAVFRALERTGLVREPPDRQNTLGLFDRPTNASDDDNRRR